MFSLKSTFCVLLDIIVCECYGAFIQACCFDNICASTICHMGWPSSKQWVAGKSLNPPPCHFIQRGTLHKAAMPLGTAAMKLQATISEQHSTPKSSKFIVCKYH